MAIAGIWRTGNGNQPDAFAMLTTAPGAYVDDLKAGDICYFPSGIPHSLQGIGPDGCEFVICFDDGSASENNPLLVSDWSRPGLRPHSTNKKPQQLPAGVFREAKLLTGE
jgi:hypothetical protein